MAKCLPVAVLPIILGGRIIIGIKILAWDDR